MHNRVIAGNQYVISGRNASLIVYVTIAGDDLDRLTEIGLVADLQERYLEATAKIEARSLPRVGAALDADDEPTEVDRKIDEVAVSDGCEALIASVSRANWLDANKAGGGVSL